jgi:hypothetical protein
LTQLTSRSRTCFIMGIVCSLLIGAHISSFWGNPAFMGSHVALNWFPSFTLTLHIYWARPKAYIWWNQEPCQRITKHEHFGWLGCFVFFCCQFSGSLNSKTGIFLISLSFCFFLNFIEEIYMHCGVWHNTGLNLHKI